jgi:hypothetical protein
LIGDLKIHVILSGAQRQSKDAGVLTASNLRRIKPCSDQARRTEL